MRRKTPGLYWFLYDKKWTVVEVSDRQDVWFIGSEVEVSINEAKKVGRFGRRLSR